MDLTIKIHELAFDIPQFVEEHRSVGFFSEKEGESLHHELNLESVQFSCFRSIPQSVEEHRSVGFFSEEEGESLHHELNLESAQFSCFRGDMKKSRFVVERHEQVSQSNCSLLTPPQGNM